MRRNVFQVLLSLVIGLNWGCLGHSGMEKAVLSSTIENDVSPASPFPPVTNDDTLLSQPNKLSVFHKDARSTGRNNLVPSHTFSVTKELVQRRQSLPVDKAKSNETVIQQSQNDSVDPSQSGEEGREQETAHRDSRAVSEARVLPVPLDMPIFEEDDPQLPLEKEPEFFMDSDVDSVPSVSVKPEETSKIEQRDHPSLNMDGVSEKQEGQTNERIVQFSFRNGHEASLSNNRLRATDSTQELFPSKVAEWVEDKTTPLPPSEAITRSARENIVNEEFPLDRVEQTLGPESHEQPFISETVVVGRMERPAEEIIQKEAQNPASTGELSEIQEKTKIESQEPVTSSAGNTEGMGIDRHEKKESLRAAVPPENKRNSFQTESQLPRNTTPLSFVGEKERAIGQKPSELTVSTGESPEACPGGRAQLTRQQYEEALSALSQSIQTYGRKSLRAHEFLELQNCYRQRAYTFLQLNYPIQALSDINQVLQGSDSGEVSRGRDVFFRGRVYMMMKDSQRAIDDFSESLELGLGLEDQAYAYYLRGLSYLRLRQIEPGLKDLSKGCQGEYSEACDLLEQIL